MIFSSIIGFFSALTHHWRLNEESHGPRFCLPEQALPHFVRCCPVAMDCYQSLVSIRWSAFPERPLNRDYPQEPVSYASFAAACLIKVESQLGSMPLLRDYLVKHPALVWLLGFRLVPSKNTAWGFDADASLPTARHFIQMLCDLCCD